MDLDSCEIVLMTQEPLEKGNDILMFLKMQKQTAPTSLSKFYS